MSSKKYRRKGSYNIMRYDSDTKIGKMYKEASVLNTLRNVIIKKGKKSVANKIVSNILMLLRSSGVSRPVSLVCRAINALKPFIETRPVKRGGQIVQVPTIVTKPRKFMLAVRWLVEGSKLRGKKRNIGMHGIAFGIAQELRAITLDSLLPTKSMAYSEAISKRNKHHKNANSNRVNVHRRKKL